MFVRDRRSGFTLIEVLVAMGIMAVALLSLLIVRDRNLEKAAQGKALRWAGMLASRKLAEVDLGIDEEGKPFAYGKQASGGFKSREGYQWQLAQQPFEYKIADLQGNPHSYQFLRFLLTITDPDNRKIEHSYLKKDKK